MATAKRGPALRDRTAASEAVDRGSPPQGGVPAGGKSTPGNHPVPSSQKDLLYLPTVKFTVMPGLSRVYLLIRRGYSVIKD